MEFPHGGAGGVWVDNQNVEKGKVRDWAAHVEGLLREIREGAPEALDTFIEVAQVLQDNENELASLITTLAQKLDASQYTAEDVLAKLRAVDGAGSGLDADLLGGVASTQYAKITDIPNYQDPDLSSIDAARLNGADASFYRNASNLNAGTVPHARLPRATEAQAKAGTDNITLMTPYRTKQAIDTAGIGQEFGVGQTWRDMSDVRLRNTWYQNTTGKPIQLFVKQISGGDIINIGPSTTNYVSMSNRDHDSDLDNGGFWVVPDNNFYRITTRVGDWFELR